MSKKEYGVGEEAKPFFSCEIEKHAEGYLVLATLGDGQQFASQYYKNVCEAKTRMSQIIYEVKTCFPGLTERAQS